jgi:hypothetical protein
MQSACAVLYCHLWSVWLYHIFPHYLINGTILGKKLLNIKCVFWFSVQLWSETFLILRRIQRDIIINVHRFSCKVPLLLSDFNKTSIFSTDIRKILKYQISWKSVQWKPRCSMRADGQIDMTKPTVAFPNLRTLLKSHAKVPNDAQIATRHSTSTSVHQAYRTSFPVYATSANASHKWADDDRLPAERRKHMHEEWSHCNTLHQWYSAWGTRTPGVREDILGGT